VVTRRLFLAGVAATCGLLARPARASVARGLSLGELLYDSRHVVLGTAVDSFARWERVGSRSCIVTYSVFHVEQPLDGRAPATSEVMIRSLGGTVGDVGQTFHGEAVVALQQRAAVFIHDVAPDVYVVTAMAQGYYPVLPDPKGVHRLRAAFGSVELVAAPSAAMSRMHGRTVPEACDLIAEEQARGAR
jgi:hypothetical protein